MQDDAGYYIRKTFLIICIILYPTDKRQYCFFH